MPGKTIFERFDTRFSRDLLVQLGEKAATRALRLWERTGLPEPAQGKYIFGTYSVSIPLQGHGISFVFRSKSRNPLRHDLYEGSLTRHDDLLQPLYRRILDETACFEIRPGIKRVNAKGSELADLGTRLKQAGLKLHSKDDGIVGLLPTGKRDLVVANALAVKGKPTRQDAALSRQSGIYGDLAFHVTDAFSSASSATIREALDTCRHIASKPEGDPAKILYDAWQQKRSEGNADPVMALIISS